MADFTVAFISFVALAPEPTFKVVASGIGITVVGAGSAFVHVVTGVTVAKVSVDAGACEAA